MPHRSPSKTQSFTSYQFRPALPADRRQIRRLLSCYHYPAPSFSWRQLSQFFCLGLLLTAGLHWLFVLGGLLLVLHLMLGLSTVIATYWLNLRLFEDWQNYWVVEQNQSLIACGRLTCYGRYTVLSDVVVAPERRRQGVGSFLITSLAQKADYPLYLACTPKLTQFYQRLGFAVIAPHLLGLSLRRELGLSHKTKLMVLQFKHHQ